MDVTEGKHMIKKITVMKTEKGEGLGTRRAQGERQQDQGAPSFARAAKAGHQAPSDRNASCRCSGSESSGHAPLELLRKNSFQAFSWPLVAPWLVAA